MTSQLKKYFFESDQQISIHEALYEVNQHLHSYEGVYHFYYAKILERLDVDQSHLISIIDQLEKGYAKKDPFSMFLYAKYLQVEKSPFYQPVKAYQLFLEAQPLMMKHIHDNDPFACHLYGGFLYQGIFMTSNQEEAVQYFQIASSHQLLESYDTLYQLHQKKGIHFNPSLSASFMEKGIQANDALLLFKKAMIHVSKKEDMETVYYLQKSADLDLSHACFALANIYIKQKQHDKAFVLMEKAASFDHPHALYMLSLAYASGKGTIKDLGKSRFYLEKAVSLNHVVSMNQLAMSLMRETPKDHVRIYELLSQATQRKDPLATYNLAMMFFLGDGVYQNQSKAYKLLDSMKHTQLPMVMYQLGVMLTEGIGTDKNEALGKTYLKQAADKKFKLANEYLNRKLKTNGFVA
jgi:TPR repeat protein